MSNMLVELILRGNASSLNATIKQSEGRFKTFGSNARRELESIRNTARSLEGKLGALGISFGALMLIRQSAELDKGLTRIGQTAGESRINVAGLRKEFFRMSLETGAKVEDLKAGFDNAVQAGLRFREALPVTDAVNKAMAVTGATADQLTSGLTVASTAYQFDLASPGMALLLLDKMTVAGRQGNAELENLSSIFARVGVNASRAGMGFDQTLGFIEGLSLLERQPERLATLADSTLRLFTNIQYLAQAQQSTGVRFFDKKGARRDPLAVLTDIKTKYDKLKTAQQKEIFMGAAFKGADLDTIKGLQALMTGDMLDKIKKMNSEIGRAPGAIIKDIPEAIKNAGDQTGRLKTALRAAVDDFIQPLNRGITAAIKKLLDAKKEGGLELSGKEIAAGGTAALIGGYAGYRLTGGALKKFLGKLGGTGAGILEGKAIETATGVTPVFVTNMPAGGLIDGSPATPGKDAINKKPGWLKNALPFLTGLGWIGATTGGGAIAADYFLKNGGSPEDLGSALHGMPETGFLNDTWINKYSGHSALPMIYNQDFKKDGDKNNFTFNFKIDKNDRITGETSTSGGDVRINLLRGDFGI